MTVSVVLLLVMQNTVDESPVSVTLLTTHVRPPSRIESVLPNKRANR